MGARDETQLLIFVLQAFCLACRLPVPSGGFLVDASTACCIWLLFLGLESPTCDQYSRSEFPDAPRSPRSAATLFKGEVSLNIFKGRSFPAPFILAHYFEYKVEQMGAQLNAGWGLVGYLVGGWGCSRFAGHWEARVSWG